MHPVKLRENGVDGDRCLAFRDLETGRIAGAKQPRPWRARLEPDGPGGVSRAGDGSADRSRLPLSADSVVGRDHVYPGG